MNREDVIQLLRTNGDAFISEAQRGEVEANQLFGVYYDSLLAGVARSQRYSIEITHMSDEELGDLHRSTEPTPIDHFRAALIQAMTASSLLIELLPEPGGTAILTTVGHEIPESPEDLN